MATESYRVEYHWIQAVYFEPGQVPSGPEFAQIWSATRIFGSHVAVGGFWHSGAEIPSILPRFEIGSLSHLEPLLAKGPQPIYGGGTVAQKNVARDSTLDADFYFALSDKSRWQLDETMPSLLQAISGQWLENTGVEAVLKNLREILAVADQRAPPYGLVDLARTEEAFAGMAYVSTWMQRLPLHRWVEQGHWVYAASKKKDRARSIYWGNYFGSKILGRLGGRDNFVRRYGRQARLADQSPNAHIWEFANGVFVSLCLDPLACKPGVPLDYSAMFNLQWLHRELGAKGVLCGWDVLSESPRDIVNRPSEPVPPFVRSQSFAKVNEAEERWIRQGVDQARMLIKTYLAVTETPMLDPANLDRAYGAWLNQWQSGKSSEAPNTVVNCIGLAFGQWLVKSLGMEWTVVTDASGTDIGVSYGPPESQVLVFPTHAVAKRLETRETGFLQELFEVIHNQVNDRKRFEKGS
jgi:hypothetical protein